MDELTLQDYEDLITDEMIRDSKEWTIRRNENAAYLSGLVTVLLQQAVRQLFEIGYKYNCTPNQFKFSQNTQLREEVAQVMEELEEDIMELVEQYSLNETDDKKRRSTLLPWLMALSSKGSKDLVSTLHERLRQFLYDTEAQVAAMKFAKYDLTKAISRALTTMHTVYAAPEMQAAYKQKSASMYVNSHGIHYGNVGLSSSGAVNVESFAYQTATLGWEKMRYEEFKEQNAVGFFVFRGSNYHCDYCQDNVGYHDISEKEAMPPIHPHCQCYSVPVFKKDT